MPLANNYYKIGLFFFLGLILFFGGLITFGFMGSVSSDAIKCETFFASSVQGLSKSSSVKFRGFEVGKVESISLAPLSSDESQPLVQVVFNIDAKALAGSVDNDPDKAQKYISNQVHNGLHATLAFQGITGISFIDLDYRNNNDDDIPPQMKERMFKSADNEMVYVPSSPGQIIEISESASRIVKSLSNIDFSAFATDLRGMVDTVNKAVEDMQTAKLSKDLHQSLQEISFAANKLGKLAEGLDNGLVGNNGTHGELSVTIKQLRQTLKRMEQVLAESQNTLPETMENLRIISENLRELSDNAKEYPSQILFGDPPKKVNPWRQKP